MRTYEDGCRCKHCGNSLVATSACTTPGTQQQIPIELLEIEQEELLQDDVVQRDYAQRCVGEEEVGGEEETETEEEDEDDCGHLFAWGVSFGASATSYHVSPMKGRGSGTHSLCLHKDLSRILGNSSLLTLLYIHFIGHRSICTVPMLFHPCTV